MKNNPSILINTIKTYISSPTTKPNLTEQDIELCIQYGLGPILADIYLKDDSGLNNSDIEKLRAIKITAQYYSALFDSAVNELIDKLSKSEIIIVLLKGMHLSKSYYKHAYQRKMGDIDILIPKDQTQIVSEALFTLGYVQEGHLSDEFFLTHQHLKPFHHPKKNTWVEVHTRLFSMKSQQNKRKLYQPQYLFENMSHIESCPENVYGLDIELNLHYTITHWVQEFKIANSLIQIVDIILIIKENQIDWDKFINLIETPVHATEIKVTLDFIIKNNLVQLPKNIQHDIRHQKDSAGIVGRLLMRTIIKNYLFQRGIFFSVIGYTNCLRIWHAYLKDANSTNNHFHALTAILIAEVPGSKSKFHSFKIRINRLYSRLMNRN